jgi:soluble lytic murein transglycosylase-like protein
MSLTRAFAFTILFAILATYILWTVAEANTIPSETYINRSFSQVAKQEKVNEKLLRAICWVESRHAPYAYNHADGPHGHAFGICQVLYHTAKQFGFRDDRCLDDFDKHLPVDRNYRACKLFGPKTNMTYAAKLLHKLVDKYNGNEFKAIAAYNTGRYKECKNGWLWYKEKKFRPCLRGGPVNFYYLNFVLQALKENR